VTIVNGERACVPSCRSSKVYLRKDVICFVSELSGQMRVEKEEMVWVDSTITRGRSAMVENRGAEAVVRDIKRRTRKKYGTEEKIRIVLEGLKGEVSIAELCRKEGLNPNVYYKWSKEFLPGREEETPGRYGAGGDIERGGGSEERERAAKGFGCRTGTEAPGV
jgi:transposase